MSQPEREVPVVRPRRKINPPTHLVDYELGAPLSHRQPFPDFSHSRVPSPAQTRSTSPVSQELDHEDWTLRDEWQSKSFNGQGEEEVELTSMLQVMKRENADLRLQTSQLPEIISALQEMRQQNALLHHELQSLKAERRAPSRPVTLPVLSSSSLFSCGEP